MKTLRARYIARARFLANDNVFAIELANAREAWNAAYPECPIHYHPGPSAPGPTGWPWQYQPAGLDGGSSLAWQWLTMNYTANGVAWGVRREVLELDQLVPGFFPQIDFPIPPNSFTPHPASIFISASLLYESRFFGDDALALMFPEHDYRLTVTFGLDWPTGKANHVSAYTEISYLAGAIRERLPHEEAERIISDARAAAVAAEQAIYAAHKPGRDSAYIQLAPGISGQDFRDAASLLALGLNATYRDQSVTERIRALRDGGYSYQRIANQLGITRQTVSKVLRDFDVKAT
jgi:hypothetical protein